MCDLKSVTCVCVQMCDVLARSMKEWERRPSERSGFSFAPGDCLAFKYLRDVSGVGFLGGEAWSVLKGKGGGLSGVHPQSFQ